MLFLPSRSRGENWGVVGYAVASHDPLSSSVIPHTIGSSVHGALLAANVLFSDGQMFASYQENIHKDFFQYLQTHWQYYQREARWEHALFWKRRRMSIRTSFCISKNLILTIFS